MSKNITLPKVSLRAAAVYHAVFFFISVTALTALLLATIQILNSGGLDRLPVLAVFTGVTFVFSVTFWFWMISALRKLNAHNEHKEN